MGKYTLTIEELIRNNVNIFDFEYSFYNESHKKGFEKKFVDRFLFDEIGSETVARFKHNLRTTLNEIMPYYTHLYETTIYEYNPIVNYDLQEIIMRDVSNEQEEEGTITDTNKNYDTPINFNGSYKNSPSNINDNENTNNISRKGLVTELHKRNTTGNIGVMTTQDLIMKERDIIINIDKLILEELNILFMGVY